MRHIEENPYGFKVDPVLFPALMQGADCPASIISALDAVLDDMQECTARQHGNGYDAVLILRGGGAKLDLACFDDYELAAVIAQYPIPVLTAIGHDQDFHVCDMVAHEYLKTPTALADYVMDIYEGEDERISSFETRIRLALSNRLYREEALLDSLAARVKGGFTLKIAAMESALQVLQARIAAADPRRILERGYALAVDEDGVVLRGASGRSVGDRVSVMFSDGSLSCTVYSITTCHPEPPICHHEPPICHPEPPICHPERSEGSPSKKKNTVKPYNIKEGRVESDGSLQLSFFQLEDPLLSSLKDQLDSADLNNMTPLQAFDLLRSMKEQLGI
jgi:hypothetical protein